MGREKLCETCGMLFVFSDSRPRTFWMKKTHIPLDIYFYDSYGQLVDGVQNMRPDRETSKPMQYTSQSAQYVIEVPAHSSLFSPEYFHPETCLRR